MTRILKGKPVADAIAESTKSQIAFLKEKGIFPSLAVIRVGNNESDLSYERTLINKAEKMGVQIHVYELRKDDGDESLCELIKSLNDDVSTHGILLFRPLPRSFDEKKILEMISKEKDVDCITKSSLGSVFAGNPLFYPCTAEAVVAIIDHYEIDVSYKDVAVLGRSMVVGKPLAIMLMDRNATVTICHSKTADLRKHTKSADIIVSCIGRKEMIDSNYVDNMPVVVDVGVNYDENKDGITGDCNYEDLLEKVSAITPVPGGVGTVTSSILLKHVVDAAKKLC